jgi:hypothetical protein
MPKSLIPKFIRRLYKRFFSPGKVTIHDLAIGTNRVGHHQTKAYGFRINKIIPISHSSQSIVDATCRAVSDNTVKSYHLTISFFGVSFVKAKDRQHSFQVSVPSSNTKLYMEPIDTNLHNVTVRCSCFTGDTLIPLLDGYSVPIKDLVDKDEFYVYSYDISSKKVAVGRGHNARLVRKNSDIVKVTFDNGNSIRCTPDHKFLLKNGTYKEVKDITPEESIQPLYRKLSDEEEKYVGSGYEMYLDSDTYKLTHRLSDEYNIDNNRLSWLVEYNGEFIDKYQSDIKNGTSYCRHHSSFNKRNNNPNYIRRMTIWSHYRLHGQVASDRMSNNNPMKNKDTVKKVIETCVKNGIYDKSSVRMKVNNPMYDKDVVEKARATKVRLGINEGVQSFRNPKD